MSRMGNDGDHPVVDRQGVDMEWWNEQPCWITHRQTPPSENESCISRVTRRIRINRSNSAGDPGFGEPVMRTSTTSY